MPEGSCSCGPQGKWPTPTLTRHSPKGRTLSCQIKAIEKVTPGNVRLKRVERQSCLCWCAQGLANMAWGFAKIELQDEAFFDLLALKTVEELERSCRPPHDRAGEWLLSISLNTDIATAVRRRSAELILGAVRDAWIMHHMFSYRPMQFV